MRAHFPARLHALFQGLARRERPNACVDDTLAGRAAELEQENATLRAQLRALQEERERAGAVASRKDCILGSIADAFFALDDRWNVVHINPAAEALFTVRRHEVLDRPVWRTFRLAGTALERALHEAARTRDVIRLEEYFRGGFYAAAVYPTKEGVSVLLTDVTQSRAVEARFRAMAEAMPQMVWSARRDGHLDYCNARFLAYTGVPGDLPEGAVWDAVHPEDSPRIQAAWRQALKSGAPYDLSLRIRDAASGEFRWFLARAVPVRGLNDQVLRWVGTCTDVHEERSRAALVRTLYDFSEALSRTETVEEVGRAACDWGRRVLGADHSITALLSDDGSALHPVAGIGVGEHFLGRVLPLEVPGAICAAVRTDSVVWAGSAEQREREFPLTLGLSLQGVAGAPLRLDGRIIGAFSIGFDDPGALTEEQVQLMEAISAQVAQAIERARLYDAQRAARSEAEEANAAKAKFLRVMSHDLRTPLNSILGYTELLQGGYMGALGPAQGESVARIRASTEMMRTQIEEILEFARIEAGRIEIRPRDVDVARVLDRIAAMLGPQASSRNIALVREPCPSELAVRADEHRLVQVLMNLVNNAANFTPAGGTIRIVAAAEGETVRLSVADTGIGIPPDKLESIFEPFVQVQAPLRTSGDGLTHGLGLGLAISRELARAMGGELYAQTAPHEGSVFTLVLPQYGRDSQRGLRLSA